MSFGFPAFHEERLSISGAVPELHARVCGRIREMNWSLVVDKGHEIQATIDITPFSWGEEIVVRFSPGEVVVRSQCMFPMQCVDWGKNRRNVRTLLSAFS